MRIFRRLTALALLLCCGCSSGGGHASLPVASSASAGGAGTHALANVTLKIDYPQTGSGSTRRPKYLSAATQSLVYYVTDLSGNVVVLGPSSSNYLNLNTVSGAYCQSNLDTTYCTVPLLLTPGVSYKFVIATFDAQQSTGCLPGPPSTCSGNQLSLSTITTQPIQSGTSNTVAIVLGGLAANIVVRPLSTGYIQASGAAFKLWGSAPQQVTAEALDADNNIIVGQGAPSVVLCLSNGSGGCATSATTLDIPVSSNLSTSPNVYTLQAATTNGLVTPGTVTLLATATNQEDQNDSYLSADSLTVAIPLTIAHSAVYVSTYSTPHRVYGFYDGNTTPSVTFTGAGSGFISPTGVAVDGSGVVYVADITNANIQKCVPVTQTCTVYLAAQTDNPYGLAVDNNGTLYEADNFNYVINAYQAVSTELTGSVSGDEPYGVAVGIDNTVYIANYIPSGTNGEILECPGTFTGTPLASSCATVTSTSLDHPYGIAVDASNAVYVTNSGNGYVTECTAAYGGCVYTAIHPALAIAVDASGNLFVTNGSGSPSITEYPNPSISATAITSFSVTGGAAWIAVVPASVNP